MADDSPITPEVDDDDALADQLPLASSSAVILRAREPFIAWLHSLGVSSDELAAAERETEVFLVPEVDRDQDVREWVQQHWSVLLASMAGNWARNQDDWPREMSQERFHEWFQVDVAAAVTDLTSLGPDEDTYSGSPVALAAAVEAFEQLDEDGLLFVDERTGVVHGLPAEMVDLLEQFDAAEGDEEGDELEDELEEEEQQQQQEEIDAGEAEEVDPSLAAVLEAYGAGALVCVATREEFDVPQVMTDFIGTVQISGVRQRLLDTLQGRKQEQRFLQAVDRAGLRDDWKQFQHEAVTAFLEDALTMRGVPLDRS